LLGSCLCWGEVEKVVGSGMEVVEWTGVEESGGKAVGGKTGYRCYSASYFKLGR
nr:hypothetical protein [Tanacetum cinerariifolium]